VRVRLSPRPHQGAHLRLVEESLVGHHRVRGRRESAAGPRGGGHWRERGGDAAPGGGEGLGAFAATSPDTARDARQARADGGQSPSRPAAGSPLVLLPRRGRGRRREAPAGNPDAREFPPAPTSAPVVFVLRVILLRCRVIVVLAPVPVRVCLAGEPALGRVPSAGEAVKESGKVRTPGGTQSVSRSSLPKIISLH
jgi:hypothetical protein